MTTQTAGYLDATTQAYVDSVLCAVEARVPITEAYLVGSGAVGGFDPATSDVDLVVVVADALGNARGSLVADLRAIPCPVRDLQLVLYVAGAQPPGFELNLNQGEELPDEDAFWFVLDAAVAQETSIPLRNGFEWKELFDPIPPERIRQAVRESLEWSAARPDGDEFGRVNAARAEHYLANGVWISKVDAAP